MQYEIIKKVKDHANDFRKKLDKYVEIRDNIRQVYGTEIDKDYLESLTWAYMSIDDAENRIKELSGELIPRLNDIAHVYSALTGEEIKVNVNNLQDLYRFMLNGKAKDEFMKTISRSSARNLGYEELCKFIDQTLKQKDEALDAMESPEGRTDDEKAKIERYHDSALDAYMQAKELLDKVLADPTLHPISDIEMNEVRQKMVDLANLLAYKTEFLDMLRVLTNNPGAFNKDVVQLHKMRMDEHNKKAAQQIYDSINDDM